MARPGKIAIEHIRRDLVPVTTFGDPFPTWYQTKASARFRVFLDDGTQMEGSAVLTDEERLALDELVQKIAARVTPGLTEISVAPSSPDVTYRRT